MIGALCLIVRIIPLSGVSQGCWQELGSKGFILLWGKGSAWLEAETLTKCPPSPLEATSQGSQPPLLGLSQG